MSLENKSVRHVLALAHYRHFARAAESLNLSQPALSRSIAVLEQGLGVQLFDRTPGGVEPTDVGRLIISRCHEIALKETELVREIKLLQGVESGELVIGAGPFPYEISVGTAFSELLSNFPKLRIRIESANPQSIVTRVLEGEFDIGVADVRDWQGDNRLEIEALPIHTGVFCCRPQHPLAGQPSLTVDEILAYPFIGTTFPAHFAKFFESFESAGSVDKLSQYFWPAVTVHSIDLARTTTTTGDFIFPTPIVSVETQLRANELVVLDCYPEWLRSNYGFISKRDRTPSFAAAKFMAILREIEAKLLAKEDALLASYAGFPKAGVKSAKV